MNIIKPFKTFMVPISAERKKATVAQDNVKCIFRFSTVDCRTLETELLKQKQKKQEAEEARKQKEKEEKERELKEKADKSKSGEHFIQKISGECFSKAKGYWTYKVCVNGDVQQFHGSENYPLGTFESNSQTKDEKNSDFINFQQRYTNGGECVNNGQKIKRETVVQYFCGDQNEIVAITETVTCKYHIVLTSVHLCGKNSPFSKYQHAPAQDLSNPSLQQIGNSDSHTHLDLDPWVLQIERVATPSQLNDAKSLKTSDMKYICSAKMVNRDLNTVPRACFSDFELEWQQIDDKKSKANSNFDLMSLIVKGEKGRDVDYAEEILISKTGNGVRSSENFRNHMEFAQIGLEVANEQEK